MLFSLNLLNISTILSTDVTLLTLKGFYRAFTGWLWLTTPLFHIVAWERDS